MECQKYDFGDPNQNVPYDISAIAPIPTILTKIYGEAEEKSISLNTNGRNFLEEAYKIRKKIITDFTNLERKKPGIVTNVCMNYGSKVDISTSFIKSDADFIKSLNTIV